MKILVTNDDGVFSPGLAAAAEAAAELGEVTIVAPTSQKTGSGRSLLGDRNQKFQDAELKIGDRRFTARHMDCTPALVVKHAFNTILKGKRFDLVVSGINYGENIGYDITVSGTVGAAMEGAVFGIPAIAISLQTPIDNHLTYGNLDFSCAGYFLSSFIERFRSKGTFEGFDVLKIDVPETADRNTEWVVTRLSPKPYFRTLLDDGHDGSPISQGRLVAGSGPFEEGTDAYVLTRERKVSVTPLTLDLTARETGKFFE
jgi:5'-nucleotidase